MSDFLLEGQLKVIAVQEAMHPKRAGSITSIGFGEDPITGFMALGILKDVGERIPLFAHEDPPTLTPQEIGYLRTGHSLLSVEPLPNGPVRIFMSRVLDPARPAQGILVGEINPTFLWDIGEEGSLPFSTELCVLDQSNSPLFCSPGFPATFHAQVAKKLTASAVGQLEWKDGREEFLASYWGLFLQTRFGVAKWTVVMNKSKADMFAPMADFKGSFFLVTLISLWWSCF